MTSFWKVPLLSRRDFLHCRFNSLFLHCGLFSVCFLEPRLIAAVARHSRCFRVSRMEFHANMRGGQLPLQGPPDWEADPRPFHLHHHGNGPAGTPRRRGATDSPCTPECFQVNPSYPPGFGKSRMRAPGSENGHRNRLGCESSHDEMNIQESLEITSDNPFLPRRRACNISTDQIPRVHKQITKDELCGPTQSLLKGVRGRDYEAPDGDFSDSLPMRPRKKTKFSPSILKDAQLAHADTTVSSSFEEANPPSVLGKPLRSGGTAVQKSSTNSFERATKVCQKLWEELNSALQQRERGLREKEQSFTQSIVNKEALEEEKKLAAAVQNSLEEEKQQVAAMKNEIMEERRKLEKEAQRIREEKDAMERSSTEIALQMVELKQLQKQLEKEKETILALKAGLSAKERSSQEQDCVEVAVTTALGTTKEEIEEPYRNCGEDDMDDRPLISRLNTLLVEKRIKKRFARKKTLQQDDLNVESSRRHKSMPPDVYMKRINVPIEVALQEDAPGLLEQLQEKGLLEDMTVFQDMGPDDSIASETPASEFGQLECVIGKLWGASSGLAKDLIPVKGQGQGSSSVPRYCLACLLSLIEQTRLMRKRNWPVLWGWCRRLRAFLFVFENHNRVVLERPEYGYATYFFELVQRLPVQWQVQRLITVMSVASTGRAALLENRQLVVGTDLTDEEAAILEDYGWNPSSGLASLLNYCDRVIHDYNKGQDPAELGSEWKQKIGKLLLGGYDRGSILTTSIPRKLESVLGDDLSDVKPRTRSNVKAEPL